MTILVIGIEAAICTAVLELDSAVGETINIGSNYEISISRTVQLIAEILEREIEVETDDSRLRPDDSEVDRLLADNTKAKRLLGWEPLYSGMEGLKRGLAETVAWFRNQDNLRAYSTDVYNI